VLVNPGGSRGRSQWALAQLAIVAKSVWRQSNPRKVRANTPANGCRVPHRFRESLSPLNAVDNEVN
jgi:hypothetical protein